MSFIKRIEERRLAIQARHQKNIIYDVYCEGLEAARAGKPISANPHGDKPGKKPEFDNWNHGWLAGHGKALTKDESMLTDFRFELYDG